MSTKNAIVVAAIDWWKAKRPDGWKQEAHLANPTVGCATTLERALAEAVAEWLEE